MKKFTYRNKVTGQTIESNSPNPPNGYVLVTHIRDGKMKANRIRTK